MQQQPTPEKNSATNIKTTSAWRVKSARANDNYTFDVEFNDGTNGSVEMHELIFSENAGVFATLQDESLFQALTVEHGVVTWPGEVDLAPDEMYQQIKNNHIWTPR